MLFTLSLNLHMRNDTNQLVVINFLTLVQRTLFTLKSRLITASSCIIIDCVLQKRHLKNLLGAYRYTSVTEADWRSDADLKKLIDDQLKQVNKSNAKQLTAGYIKRDICLPLALTFHPRLHNLSNIIKKLFFNLYADEQMKKSFSSSCFCTI